jgi:hypothetical protein
MRGLPFGTSENRVTQELSSRFGQPTQFTDYMPDFCSTGEGETGREIRWGPLTVLLNNESEGGFRPDADVPPGGLYFWGYRYSTLDPTTGATLTDSLKLRTEQGLGLGSSNAEVQAAFGAAARFYPGSPDGFPPSGFTVTVDEGPPLVLWSFNTDPRDAVVTAIIAGRSCGE